MRRSVNSNAHDNRRRRFHTVWKIELLKDGVRDLNVAMDAIKRELRTLSRSFHTFSTQVLNALKNNKHGGADNNEGYGVDNIQGVVLVTFISLFLMQ
uniref:Uncharacterized protein n=1 Tax=Solanum lycopersicum TaxID=4081 RepID=A0A3Q7HM96_SOLLC